MMNTYILLWNPNKWDWSTLEEDIDDVDLTGRCSQRWSCGVTKAIRAGDRVFLLRVGKDPRGIIGAGFAVSEPSYQQHWSGENRDALYIDVDFEVILNADKNRSFRFLTSKTASWRIRTGIRKHQERLSKRI